MSYLGIYQIDNTLVFPANTHDAATGAATDADAVPDWRLYEDETGTAILTGTMALLDSSNTAGLYSEQITLSAANGIEVGKSYTIYISAAVDSVIGTMAHTFQVVAAPVTAAAVADSVWDEARSGHITPGTYGESFRTVVSGAAITGTLSTTQMTTDLAEATDDHFNGRVVIFTSGALLYQATSITDYDGATKTITMTALTEAPSNGDTFIIL